VHTDTVAAVFTCTHCNAVPEQVVDGKATIADRAPQTRVAGSLDPGHDHANSPPFSVVVAVTLAKVQ